MTRIVIPLFVFIAIIVLLLVSLGVDHETLPSPLIKKAAPAFDLPVLNHPDQRMANADFGGAPYLVNFWASWCVACKVEHPILNSLASRRLVKLIGIDYKDTAQAANKWLTSRGDPYDLVLVDADGRVGMDFGVYGVPESFLIGANGIILYKQVGPLSETAIEREILPRLNRSTSQP